MLKEIKTNCYEPFYTLTNTEKIVDLQRTRRTRAKARMRIRFLWQKLCGVFLVVMGCVITVVDNTAGMATIVCVVVGIGLIF